MQRWNSREELEHQIITLTQQGMGLRAIARAIHVTRLTIRRVLAKHAVAREAEHCVVAPERARAPRDTKLTPHVQTVHALFVRYPDITAQRVFEILRDEHEHKGGYTAVKEMVRKMRPKPVVEPSLPAPEYGPGEMAESDWTPVDVDFTHAPRTTLQVFGYVLCCSSRKYFGAYEHADLHALMDGHVRAFERNGGVAAGCKYDGQRAVVRWEGRQPIYNPRFLAFASHYEFRVIACRPGRPDDKPKVERSFLEHHRSFTNGRTFRDPDDYRAQLAHWMATICDGRKHKKLKRVILEMFAEEAPFLRPLPRHPYDTARVVYRVCSVDGFVAWDGNRYAVPYEFLYDLLPVRITQRELFVYAPDLRVIAKHELAPASTGLDLDPAQIHPRAALRGIDMDQIRRAYADLDPAASEYLAALEQVGTRSGPYHARQILLLRERFGSDDLVAALKHARSFGAFEHTAVARILQARATPRALDEYIAEQTADRIEALLGRAETRPRDLAEYDALPAPRAVTSPQEKPCPSDLPIHEPPRTLAPLRNQSPSPNPSPTTNSSHESDSTSKPSD